MSNYIASSTDLTSIANAIRTKGGTSAQLAFPAGFVSAIEDIPTGGGGDTVYYASTSGQPYWANTVIPAADYSGLPTFNSCGELVSLQFESTHTSAIAGSNRIIGNNVKLKNLVVNAIINSGNNYLFGDDTALETVQLGGLGRACGNQLNANIFRNCTQQGLTITVYVADNQTLPLSNAPWGATNATIIYRSETTGEVVTP